MSAQNRTVLITGCSEGGVGYELAKQLHFAGLHVIATARDTSKMKGLEALDIETLPLDIQSDTSITSCVQRVPRLDMLINNAGANTTMPVTDLSLPAARKMFDLNVWGHIAVTQAFLPLLLKSPNAMIVNHTSTAAHVALPFSAVYNSAKAAM